MGALNKKELKNCKIDIDSIEELLSEMLDSVDMPGVDLTKPIKMGFSVSLGQGGKARIESFDISNDSREKAEPLVDIIDAGAELTIVIGTSPVPAEDVEITPAENALIISNRRSGEFIKRVCFPCKVRLQTISTTQNNGVLEVRVEKSSGEKTVNEKVIY